jgi:hypothetical protein
MNNTAAWLIIGGFILLVIVLNSMRRSRGRHAVSAHDRALHRGDGDSHVYYYSAEDDALVHESDTCSGCMHLRVEELHRKGARIDEVVYGRRNSGDLAW